VVNAAVAAEGVSKVKGASASGSHFDMCHSAVRAKGSTTQLISSTIMFQRNKCHCNLRGTNAFNSLIKLIPSLKVTSYVPAQV
jgi:hypothetical protein